MREPNRAVFFLVVPALVGAASVLWALSIVYPKGGACGYPDWPAGLQELANTDASLGGYSHNTNDQVYFSGDTRTLNRFLERYAQARVGVGKFLQHVGRLC